MRTRPANDFSARNSTQDIRDRILEAALPNVPFDGWTWKLIEQAAVNAGYGDSMARSVFPGGLSDALDHFSSMADKRMLERLENIDPETLRVRDRIHTAVMARLRVLYPWRDAVRQATSYWAMPSRTGRGIRIMWRTADAIWNWAGDTATDYNRYTKRTLLCGVLVSTILAWLEDDSHGMSETEAFLDRRINTVLTLGKALGKMKSFTQPGKTRRTS
ncbi:MAG: COQ9 family protein [Micavibrio aeruginosavorus]|uniref:COQ9 family protein n=1 Tax=Micavibrio aeruginosavorus TaxID=349221 RepID=A0A7T5UGY8_9BACT|nr:MAG: COQ9 family protein [Micavibrio aeruginosavorus]